MLGAIIGDIVGSIYEFDNIRTKDFELFSSRCFFTDDTVMTVAIYKALKNSKMFNYALLSKNTVKYMQKYGKMYPDMSYGLSFRNWLQFKNPKAYGSYGNGSAMRVSPAAYFARTLDEAKFLSYMVTAVTHDHEEGVKGAEATTVAIYMALNGSSKEEIKKYIEENYYKLDFDYEDLVKNYKFNETCQNTVPQAIFCFLISDGFEDCLRTSISIGGDSDTLCAISCAIAEAYYGIPEEIKDKALEYLDEQILSDYEEFKKGNTKYTNNILINELINKVIANEDANLRTTLMNIVSKIIVLKDGTRTTIAKLIDYDPKVSFVEPLIQGKIKVYVDEICKEIGIKLERSNASVGGLAYFNEFVKKEQK